MCAIIIGLFLFEFLFRFFFIENKSLYMEGSYNTKPKHLLINNWESKSLIIKDGQRIHSHLVQKSESNKKYKVALIGDSVGFGSYLATQNTLAYLIETESENINVTNYSVPGYGVFDHFQVIKKLKKDKYDLIIYQLSKNDITLASAGRFSLLRDDDEVIVRYNEIDQKIISKFKVFLQRNLKSVYVIGSYIKNKNFFKKVDETRYKEAQSTKCFNEIYKNYISQIKVENFLNQAYTNKLYTNKMTDIILNTKEYVNNSLNTEILLFPIWNFHDLNNFDNSPFKNYIYSLSNVSEIPIYMLENNIHFDYKKCGYWQDAQHPGIVYMKTISKYLSKSINTILNQKNKNNFQIK